MLSHQKVSQLGGTRDVVAPTDRPREDNRIAEADKELIAVDLRAQMLRTIEHMVHELEYRRERATFLRYIKHQLEMASQGVVVPQMHASNRSRMLYELQNNFHKALSVYLHLLRDLAIDSRPIMHDIFIAMDDLSIRVMQDGDTFGYLVPDDVLAHIFSFLEVRHIPKMSLVCKQWHNVTQNEYIWKKFYNRWMTNPRSAVLPARTKRYQTKNDTEWEFVGLDGQPIDIGEPAQTREVVPLDRWNVVDMLQTDCIDNRAETNSIDALGRGPSSYKRACQLVYAGVQLWNGSPTAGINFLQCAGVLPTPLTVDAVVQLLEHPMIDFVTRGVYVARANPFNREVLKAYAQTFDFKNLHIVDAMRKIIRYILISGESQSIDRIVDEFAKVYHEQNPTFASSADAVHIVFYAILMLNTDLHNAAIKKHRKMTITQFMKSMRDIDHNFTQHLLTEIYMDIKYCELSRKPHWRRDNEMSQRPRRAPSDAQQGYKFKQ